MLIESIELATRAHHGQVRLGSGDPYIVHPLRVARLVRNAGGDEDMQAAAVLHDVLEDTPMTIEAFPQRIQDLVRWLTKVPGTDRLHNIERLETAPDDAVIIKLADRVDNITDARVRLGKEWMAERWPASTWALVTLAQRHGFAGHGLTVELRRLAEEEFPGAEA